MIDKLTPTDEQAQIMTDIADPAGGSVMVEAYAGTAKSTTIELSAPGVRVPALAVAFNRSIAKELQPRLPQNFTVKTFNGLGYGAWMRANTGVKRWELDERKSGKIISQIIRERKLDGWNAEQWDQARQLMAKAMQAGLTPGNIGAPLARDDEPTWVELADQCWITADDRELMVDVARDALLTNIDLAKRGTISFDDQVYCPTVLGGLFPRYPFVVTDEAQDLNPLNHRMLDLSTRSDGRMMAVGDSRQAIYAFRGADSESMGNLRRIRPAWTDRRLTLTFRCPKAIVERQQGHAPGYRAAEQNVEGAFRHLRRPEPSAEAENWRGWSAQDLFDAAVARPGRTPTIAILCRNNSPIMSLAFKLIRQRIGVMVLGRDIGKGLIALLSKICKDEEPSDVIMSKITDWQQKEVALALANDKEEKVAGITDRGESLMACLEGSEARTAGELKAIIKQLFEKEDGQLTLSSIHRSKGLEWDLVLHLDPFRIPSRYAKQAAQQGDRSQLQQEFNLLYVCETRTKHTLINAKLEDFND